MASLETPPAVSSLQALESAAVTVTKIGGENAVDLGTNLGLIASKRRTGRKQILVISAPRSADPAFSSFTHQSVADRDKLGRVKPGFNTTSHLIALAKKLAQGDRATARSLFSCVEHFIGEVISRQCVRDGDAESLQKEALLASIRPLLEHVETCIATADPRDVVQCEQDWLIRDGQGYLSITGLGEAIVRNLYGAYFRLRRLPAGIVDSDSLSAEVYNPYANFPSDVVRSGERSAAAVKAMREHIRCDIDSLLGMQDILIAGGYVPVLGGQRGYSDKTGAFIARAVQETGRSVAFVIEKQFPVMSADPRLVPEASVVPEMTPGFAMEAFGNVHGADGGAIHPEALAMLSHTGIDTYVLDPTRAEPGRITRIHRFDPQPGGIDMVAVKPVPTVVQVRSTKMFNRPGFLESMSEWFAGRGISVDQIFSSEVTISFTFANGGVGEEDIAAFQQFLAERYADDELSLHVRRDRAAIYCMGNNIAGVGPLSRMMQSLEQAGVTEIDFLTRGARESIIAIIDREQAAAALTAVHAGCVS